jgi:hypothetical protein
VDGVDVPLEDGIGENVARKLNVNDNVNRI